MQEVWKDVVGYEGLYQVSNLGNVKSLKFGKERTLKYGIVPNNLINRIYKSHFVNLYKDGKIKRFYVHRLVYQAFNGVIPEGYQIDHINNDPEDNRLENLQLLTRSENCKKRYTDNTELRYNYRIEPTKIICLNTGKIYKSQHDAARELKLISSNITEVLKGRRNSTHGYKFKYVN